MQRIVGVLALALSLVLALPAVAQASNDPFFPEQWALAAIGAETAWAQGRGAGTVIAVIDTGLDLDHEDLAGKVVPGFDFIDDDASPEDALRSCSGSTCNAGRGHGTHIAGIAAASTGNGTGVAGVAPDAQIMPVKVLDSAGSGTVVDVEAGIRFAVDNGADVLNLSFGEESFGLAPGFTRAIRYAWDNGVIPVVAAGNRVDRQSIFSDEPVLVVTATANGDTRPSYASGVGNAQWGMAAPGGDGNPSSQGSQQECDRDAAVISTYLDNTYACLVGTSMAVPHVAGAAAVLRGMGFTPQQTVDRLLSSVDDVGAPGRDTTFGAGRLNLARAVQGGPTPVDTAPPTTQAPATIAAAPPTTQVPTTTTLPPTTTTEAPTTTTTRPVPRVSLPPATAVPVEPPTGEAIALLPDDGNDSSRYVLAVPATMLLAGVGSATWRVRRQLSKPGR